MTTGSVADPFRDLLAAMDEGPRQGLVRRLAVGYYEGWQPTRAEVAALIDLETGRISEAEYLASQRSRLGPLESQRPANDPFALGGIPGSPDTTDPAKARSHQRGGLNTDPATSSGDTGFGVDCGELAPPFRFIARGLSDDGSVGYEGQRYRLVYLRYELVPPGTATATGEPIMPVFFTAPILCVPDVPTLRTVSDGKTTTHVVGTGSVAGSRGSWALSPDARQLRFLIYAQPRGQRPSRHPAGRLRLDLQDGEADWIPVARRRPTPRAKSS